MTQKTFSGIEDLVFDRSFRNWVLNPRNETAFQWNQTGDGDTAKAEIINQAKAIVYALQINESQLTEEEINTEISRVLAKIKNDSFVTGDLIANGKTKRISIHRSVWLKVAAILVLVTGSYYLFFNRNSVNHIDSYKEFAAAQKEKPVEYYNGTKQVQVISLPDSSIISLEPKSRISYAANFKSGKREVYLVGEAFFEVAKDPAHPFFVYSNDIVTKVLGTSFRIKAPEGTKLSEVIVKTGKVSVFQKKNFTNADAKPGELGGTVLLPNQQVTYNSEASTSIKSLVAEPLPVIHADNKQFVFNATPLKEVFQTLERVYGIRIIVDDETISTCSLSASMGNESFYQKLDLICKSLNATYEVVDGDIVITSVGCKQ